MSKIEINRRFFVDSNDILKISIKKWKHVWVYFLTKNNQIQIARLYQPLDSFLTHINYLRISEGKEKIKVIKE